MHTQNLGQMCPDRPAFSVDINKNRQLGILGFRYKLWLEDPDSTHMLRFLHSSEFSGLEVEPPQSSSASVCSTARLNDTSLPPPPSPSFTLPSVVTNLLPSLAAALRHYPKCPKRSLF